MKRWALAVGGIAVVGLCVWGVQFWCDTHPNLEMTRQSLKNYGVSVPAGWQKPAEDGDAVLIRSAPDERGIQWSLTIIDEGAKTDAETVMRDLKKGFDEREGVKTVRLDNGISVSTWVDLQPLGELNREVRAFVFKAGNGHVYSALLPLTWDRRANRRYVHIYNKVLGSLEFAPHAP